MTQRSVYIRQLTTAPIALICVVLIGGCASSFSPKPADQIPFLERSVTQEQEGIRVTSAVPSANETRDLFGTSLYSRGVQPVWLEIENESTESVRFLSVGLDANYFTSIEAASFYKRKSKQQLVERHFFQSGIDTTIAAGETRSGFLFTHLDEGTKSFNIDIAGASRGWAFTFFIPVPGLRIDHHNVDFSGMYSPDEVSSFDNEEDLIAALQDMPCCTTDKAAKGSGDPLNLVIIGNPLEIYYAFLRAGWDETETTTAASTVKTIAAFFSGGEYRYSPVSSLYVFGRAQDVAFQKIRENINERNHLRLWMAPVRFHGEPVWIGQISRDIGVRFTKKTITTHKIDADVDETREFLLENLAYNQVLEKFAYVSGVGEAPYDRPRGNLTGDPYFTDGLRAVFWVSSESVDLQDIEFEDWKLPQN